MEKLLLTSRLYDERFSRWMRTYSLKDQEISANRKLIIHKTKILRSMHYIAIAQLPSILYRPLRLYTFIILITKQSGRCLWPYIYAVHISSQNLKAFFQNARFQQSGAHSHNRVLCILLIASFTFFGTGIHGPEDWPARCTDIILNNILTWGLWAISYLRLFCLYNTERAEQSIRTGIRCLIKKSEDHSNSDILGSVGLKIKLRVWN